MVHKPEDSQEVCDVPLPLCVCELNEKQTWQAQAKDVCAASAANYARQRDDDVPDVKPDLEWEEGVHYTLIRGRLYFSTHIDDDYTLSVIAKHTQLFYFSSGLPGLRRPPSRRLSSAASVTSLQWYSRTASLSLCAEMYSSFCLDFGPTNIAFVVDFCRCVPMPCCPPRCFHPNFGKF